MSTEYRVVGETEWQGWSSRALRGGLDAARVLAAEQTRLHRRPFRIQVREVSDWQDVSDELDLGGVA